VNENWVIREPTVSSRYLSSFGLIVKRTDFNWEQGE